jgi:hypothetical protein
MVQAVWAQAVSALSGRCPAQAGHPLRLHSPLIEPCVRISRTRLSEPVLRAPPLPRVTRPPRTGESSDLPSRGASRVAPLSVSACRLHCPGGQLKPH